MHPPKPPEWPENVKKWYVPLRRSGQAALFDYSDWALALQAGDCLTYARASLMNNPKLALGWMRMFDDMYQRLCATFIDRRRERLEVHRGDVPEGGERGVGHHHGVPAAIRMKALRTLPDGLPGPDQSIGWF